MSRQIGNGAGKDRVVVRAQATEVLLGFPDHVHHVGGVGHPVPVLVHLDPDAADAVAVALHAQAESVRKYQGARVLELPAVGRLSLTQLPPYPEQRDGQLQYLEDKRKIILTSAETELFRIWRHETRHHTV